ncbi:heterokaryon incompatibility protein-domain-containing protein, partial [Bisporella sp. PMI_857]
AKEWIAECKKFHPKCAKPKYSSLPTRLVDVLSLSKAGKVKVVETQKISIDSGIQYVALSYCWGLTPTFKLEKSTRQALLSGVAMEILPRTLQDAIKFTRNINLDWLWVDSLCIIQDSQEDWNHEALTMRQVYQDSFLTVAALGGASKQGENICGGQDSTIGLALDAWPLHQRGWVMQERVLASRTLNFGPYLIWQCQEKLADEYNIIARSLYKMGFELNKHEAILGTWTEIAYDYTSGTLTVATDRLLAISGIISAIHRRTGWTNLAGLWKPFLWKQVLWEKAFDAVPESREHTGLQPSWSWTAITGGVMW